MAGLLSFGRLTKANALSGRGLRWGEWSYFLILKPLSTVTPFRFLVRQDIQESPLHHGITLRSRILLMTRCPIALVLLLGATRPRPLQRMHIDTQKGTSSALITTIIPTYHRPGMLKKSIETIQGQTVGAFLVHVHDDASMDDTKNTVENMMKTDSRIRYFGRTVNVGMFKNQKDSMLSIETPYFSFLHDDDELLPNFYQAALDGFKRHPEAMFSACVTLKKGLNGKIYNSNLRKWAEGVYRPPEGLMKILQDGIPHWSAILFRREIIEKVGLIDEGVGHYFDHDLMNRIAIKYPICFSKTPGSVYVFHGENYGSMADDVLELSSFTKMIDNITTSDEAAQDVKDRFYNLLRHRYRKQCMARALLLLKDRRYKPFQQCIAILNHLGWHRDASRLVVLEKVCKYSMLPAFLRLSYGVFRRIQKFKVKRKMAFTEAVKG